MNTPENNKMNTPETNPNNSPQLIPSEYMISEKWDRCMEAFIVNFSAGLIGAGLTSMVVAKSATSRAALTAFGAGVGTGSTWTKCSLLFQEKPKDDKDK